MAIELYDATVACFLQTLGGMEKFLEKGRLWLIENKISLDTVVEHRVAPDMFPFRFQVVSSVHHSMAAIRGVKAGVFNPPLGYPDFDYAGLQTFVSQARAELAAATREEINALQGKDVTFSVGERKVPFVAEDFLLSFSMPNHHFHVTMAYGILRGLGVPLGKRDYMGQLKIKA